MKLTAENVRAVATDCLFTDDEYPRGVEVPEGAVVVEGIVNKYGFHPTRLEDHRADVASMLDQLEDSFKTAGGGGMSFLRACYDKDDNHWGEHPTMGLLFGLGIGLGIAHYTLPRDMWPALPGGVPYITIDSDKVSAAISPNRIVTDSEGGVA